MRLNTTCSLGDVADDELRSAIRTIGSGRLQKTPAFPSSAEHRKDWEQAMTLLAFRRHRVLCRHAELLSVAGGREDVAFYLTNEARRVFLTDSYGEGQRASSVSQAAMLVNPASQVSSAVERWNGQRLVVQHMDAHSLRFEDESFDGVWSLSSIEHMGGIAGAKESVAEQLRVTRRGGIVVVVTECVVNGAPGFVSEGLSFFTPEELVDICSSPLGEPVEPFVLASPAYEDEHVLDLATVVANAQQGIPHPLPHVYLAMEGRIFTSACVVLRRRSP